MQSIQRAQTPLISDRNKTNRNNNIQDRKNNFSDNNITNYGRPSYNKRPVSFP